jgi:asparagine synthase (glutamine-hydrolysing)
LIDELPFAREVAQQYRTEHYELQATIDVASMLRRMDEVYDEPFADSSNIPTFMLAEHARRHVTVALSGDGGDELFGGYSWYMPLLDENGPPDRWERHVAGSTAALADRTALWGGFGRQPQLAEMFRRAYRPPTSVTEMDSATHFDATCYLPGDILVKVDRAAMAHGLETRAPFLDAELADYVLSLPWRMRFGGTQLKHLLRRACGHLWPASIRERGKQGFGAPVRHWLQQPEVAAMWERVSKRSSALCALLPGVQAVKQELRPQRTWTLLCLGLWLERRSECLAALS